MNYILGAAVLMLLVHYCLIPLLKQSSPHSVCWDVKHFCKELFTKQRDPSDRNRSLNFLGVKIKNLCRLKLAVRSQAWNHLRLELHCFLIGKWAILWGIAFLQLLKQALSSSSTFCDMRCHGGRNKAGASWHSWGDKGFSLFPQDALHWSGYCHLLWMPGHYHSLSFITWRGLVGLSWTSSEVCPGFPTALFEWSVTVLVSRAVVETRWRALMHFLILLHQPPCTFFQIQMGIFLPCPSRRMMAVFAVLFVQLFAFNRSWSPTACASAHY